MIVRQIFLQVPFVSQIHHFLNLANHWVTHVDWFCHLRFPRGDPETGNWFNSNNNKRKQMPTLELRASLNVFSLTRGFSQRYLSTTSQNRFKCHTTSQLFHQSSSCRPEQGSLPFMLFNTVCLQALSVTKTQIVANETQSSTIKEHIPTAFSF